MTTTRLTTEEALALVCSREVTENHVLVTHVGRFRAERRDGLTYRFWYGDGNHDWVFDDELKSLIVLAGALVELEEPSVFEAPEFEGWEPDAVLSDCEYYTVPCRFGGWYSINADGCIYCAGTQLEQVPVADIPKAAAHINALLALGVNS